MTSAVEQLGAQFERGWDFAMDVIVLGEKTFREALTKPVNADDLFDQIENIGQKSVAVAVLTAVFSSMVMVVQFGVQLQRFGAKEYVGSIVSLSLVRELGPVLTALMVGGRVGAGIAAELGSMAVTEQIDAIRSMGADPVRKLVVPRVLASIIVLPLLTALSDFLGVLGACLTANIATGVNMVYFMNATLSAVHLSDLLGGLVKTIFFGLFISLIACQRGLSTRGGTEGVGRSTTQTVVITSITTLIADFVLTTILLQLGL